MLALNVSIWSWNIYITVQHCCCSTTFSTIANHYKPHGHGRYMVIKSFFLLNNPAAWECDRICWDYQCDHLKPRRLEQEADGRMRCVCCSWCCESGRCHTSAITRLFHNTRVAPHCCQPHEDKHNLSLLKTYKEVEVEIKPCQIHYKTCLCLRLLHFYAFIFFYYFVSL